MNDQKPNHICKNPDCKNGVDGKPKHYWACNDCDKFHSYREVACSPECYKEYITAVMESRIEHVMVKSVPTETIEVVEEITEEPIAKDVVEDIKTTSTSKKKYKVSE